MKHFDPMHDGRDDHIEPREAGSDPRGGDSIDAVRGTGGDSIDAVRGTGGNSIDAVRGTDGNSIDAVRGTGGNSIGAVRGTECESVHDQLPLFVGGDLDAPRAQRVAGHLDTCGPCREQAARLRRAFESYFAVEHHEAARELAGRSLWPDLRAQLFERVDAAKGASVGAHQRGPSSPSRADSRADARAERDARDEILELELSGAGTLELAGMRGRRVIGAMLGAFALAAAAVFTHGSLWTSPAWNGAPDGAGRTDRAELERAGGAAAAARTVADRSGHAASVGDGATAHAAQPAGPNAPLAAAPLSESHLGGLVPILPADDERRLIHTAPLPARSTGSAGAAGPQLAGDARVGGSDWR